MRWWQNNCSENKKKKSFAGFVKKKCHKTFKTLIDSSFFTVGNMPTCGAAGNRRCFRFSRGCRHSSVRAWRDVANEVWHGKWAVAHFHPSGRLSAEVRWRNRKKFCRFCEKEMSQNLQNFFCYYPSARFLSKAEGQADLWRSCPPPLLFRLAVAGATRRHDAVAVDGHIGTDEGRSLCFLKKKCYLFVL